MSTNIETLVETSKDEVIEINVTGAMVVVKLTDAIEAQKEIRDVITYPDLEKDELEKLVIALMVLTRYADRQFASIRMSGVLR